jgi:2-C-methyl-D-erythritol 4-phosphate cytidylyltransferase
VAVHDAVRPLVTAELIENVIRKARRYKAALAAAPSKDTVKLAERNGFIRATPDRRQVWLAQTPQVFEKDLLDRAHDRAHALRLNVTDDAQLVERMGLKVRLVEAPSENLKITRPIDLVLAKTILGA